MLFASHIEVVQTEVTAVRLLRVPSIMGDIEVLSALLATTPTLVTLNVFPALKDGDFHNWSLTFQAEV